MKFKTLFFALLISSGFNLLGCGDSDSQDISGFFEAVEDTTVSPTSDQELGLDGTDKFLIKVTKTAMQEKFLLSMSTIPQKQAATSTGLAAKVVTFKRFGDVIDMYEVNDGNVVTDNLPAQTLLAQFPVVASDTGSVTIDFDKGMKDVYTTIWYNGGAQFESTESTLDIRASRVFEVKTEGDLLLIRHAVLARQSSLFGTANAPVEMRYYLSKYKDSDFASKEVGELTNVGFFGVPSKLEKFSGRLVNNAIRFDLDKPLKFYYSANTPDDYVEAVKDGVTYWNKAFGKKVVEVEKAPAGVSAPDPKHNVIQWVEWDEAGFAYADVLANPLTGESLHGQVYMTSVFAFKSKERVRRLIRLLSLQAENTEKKKEGMIVPNFSKPLVSCGKYSDARYASQLQSSLSAILAVEGISEEAILRVSQDYVREVIGHEVGHVLGLRHNFAGTDASNMTPNEKNEWLEKYLKDQAVLDESKVPVTTVMDYSTPIDAYYAGWYMRKASKALPYDHAAIQWGYFDDEKVRQEKFLFCTDDHVESYSDCNRFDLGPSIADATAAQVGEAVANLPGTLLEAIIAKKTAYHPSLQVKVSEQILNPAEYAGLITSPLAAFLSRFDASKRLVAVDRTFDYVGPLNEEEILEARWERLNKELKSVGGINAILFSYLPGELAIKSKEKSESTAAIEQVSAEAWTKKFNEALDSDAYKEFVGGDGKKHSFTDSEKAYMKKQAPLLFAKVEKLTVQKFLAAFQKVSLNLGTAAHDGVVQDEDVANEIQSGLASIVGKVVLSQNKKKEAVTGTLAGAGVWVHHFEYDQATRELAAGTFSSLQGNFPGWSDSVKSSLGEKFKASVEGALNTKKIADFKPAMLSPSILNWYKEQQKIGVKLGASL